MIRIANVKASLDFTPDDLKSLAAKAMRLRPNQIASARLSRKSVDARKRSDVHFVLSIDVMLTPDARFIEGALARGVTASEPRVETHSIPNLASYDGHRPMVVGLGPAGLFAALTLARAGLRPVVIERGLDVDRRARDVKKFFATGELDPCSNVQFGEGGAGAFSDGKLTTGISDPRCNAVLSSLIEAGAPEEIRYEAKPHIGTDRLPGVVRAIRETIRLLGGDVFFSTRLCSIILEDGRVAAAEIESGDGERRVIPTNDIILAVGHSARDTFEALFRLGVPMIRKPFSIGVRIEHDQRMVNRAQYGAFCDHPALGAAEYRLNERLKNGRDVYTFCMCPGGQVVAAASEKNGVVTNGMSVYARDGKNANSALLVSVTPDDFEGDHPLAGIEFQRHWERLAYERGGGGYVAPAQLVGDFLQNQPSSGAGDVHPSYRPGVIFGRVDECLPRFAAESLRAAIPLLDQKLRGFASPGGVLTAVETRSSSPLRIPRDAQTLMALPGLYPSGEGAGYAGGILSAAVDGVRCAEALIDKYAKPDAND